MFLLTKGFLYSQESPDYRETFGDKYKEAAEYLQKNPWITITLAKNNVNPCMAQAIIFPELIRYSYLRDIMEVQALKTLYVQYGAEYADFSVGRFQIKPSFAEKLETDLKSISIFKTDARAKNIDTSQTYQARLERIKRLDCEEWQVQYLIWFIKIMNHKYPELAGKSTVSSVRFLATAYNYGYYHPEKQIRENMNKAFFHTAMFRSDHKYSYASVSCFYWRECNP